MMPMNIRNDSAPAGGRPSRRLGVPDQQLEHAVIAIPSINAADAEHGETKIVATPPVIEVGSQSAVHVHCALSDCSVK